MTDITTTTKKVEYDWYALQDAIEVTPSHRGRARARAYGLKLVKWDLHYTEVEEDSPYRLMQIPTVALPAFLDWLETEPVGVSVRERVKADDTMQRWYIGPGKAGSKF